MQTFYETKRGIKGTSTLLSNLINFAIFATTLSSTKNFMCSHAYTLSTESVSHLYSTSKHQLKILM